jgi:hypothetical protein
MALTYPQRGFAGAAVAGTLASPGLTAINGAGVTFTSSTTLTGWTEIANGSWSGDNICVTFGYGTASEEKILCTFNSGTSTFTIVTRGYDGTSAVAHATGSLFILTSTATEAAELNAVTQSMKNLLLTNGLSALPADISTSAAALGTSINPASADHTHKLPASTLNNWLSGSASGQMNSAVSVYLSSLASGALPTAITTSRVWNPTATSTSTGPSQSGITGYNNYIIVAWSKATTTTATAAQLSLSITANTVTGINPVSTTIQGVSNGTAMTMAYVSPGASTTFSAQCMPSTSGGTVGSWANYLIVIGIN